MSFGKSPLVFVVTDTKSKTLNIAYNLFSDAVRQTYGISNIRCVRAIGVYIITCF